ncbi:SUPPRESSOR OF GAMMA RESPONSE 1-like [Hordeum vulgare subsp. vulgare]|uniref:SUPPRESSOR OF GAMMA RESPONSE 1-like n=1 Tax=Hordeum vulgare subsp. vulgare TaxID=112509 RepID=UPI001D1A414B|nr:SUPPRESSOR OF GAMMA RESPONSE 1-like [Hordeum vulgare subsp. vulgare]
MEGMCVPESRRSVSGTNAWCFVFLDTWKVAVDGEAPGAGDDAGALVLGDEVREEDEEEMEVSLHVVHQWPGLPKGVKFDPSDQELLGHLLAKHAATGSQPNQFIEEFIPTVEEADGICYTRPQKLPGVKQDGSVSHFFHRTFKAYNTGTRKRGKINTGDLADVRWHKTSKTKPVIVDGQHLGCKKIMVLYMSTVKGGKPKKTNWVMHQYHLGTREDEQNGEYVVSKLFFQQQSKPGEKSALELFVPKK